MKCPNCGYFNMPGATACGQCRRALGAGSTPSVGAAVPISEIYPPRAAKRSARENIDAQSPTIRRAKNFMDDVRRSRARNARPPAEPWDWRVALHWWIPPVLSLVPGLGQLWQRRFSMSAIFVAATTLFTLLGIAFFFDTLSNYFLAVAIAIAWCGIWDAANHSFPPGLEEVRYWRALRLGFLALNIVSLSICGAFWLSSFRYTLWNIQTNQAAPVFQAGDSLVVEYFQTANPFLEARRGDVVVADATIERVLGLPGDRVVFQNGVLRVNGKTLSASQMPLSFAADSQPFDAKVPPGQMMLWQTVRGNIPEYGNGRRFYRLVTQDDLEGRVIGIYNPPGRRRSLRGAGEIGSTP